MCVLPQPAPQGSEIGNWYVVAGGNRLRGPYTHAETAAAVRAEMERDRHWDRMNLCVVQFDPLPTHLSDDPRQQPETD